MEIKKSFVSQVTKEQLDGFFKTQGFKVTNSHISTDSQGEHIYVSAEGLNSVWGFPVNNRLYDYHATGFSKEWPNFLYDTFGKEYLVALKKHITKKNNDFMKSLTSKSK